MASNARNLSKLLGTSTQVPTTALPTAIADLETIGTSLSGGDIAPKNISSNTLTQSFDSNQTVNFNMSDSIDTISPIISVFKEIPQPGVSSKGNWDVNANATNYEFFDEKPISYSSVNLTPSATGDGTFTLSSGTFDSADVGKKVVGNSGSALITATSGTYKSVTAFANTSAISSWQLFGAEGKSDGSGIALTGISVQAQNINQATANSLDGQNGTSAGFQPTFMRSIHVSDDGTHIAVTTSNTQTQMYQMSTPFDITTIGSAVSTLSRPQYASGFWMNGDGTRYVIANFSGTEAFFMYNMSTPYDFSTATANGSFSDSTITTNNPAFVEFSADGSKMFYGFTDIATAGVIGVLTMSTPWNLSSGTASYLNFNNTFGYNPVNEYVTDFFFNSTGLRFFINSSTGSYGNRIRQYNLTSAYDLSTASYYGTDLNLSGYTHVYHMQKADNGSKLIFHGNDGSNQALGVYDLQIDESVTHPYSQYLPALTNSSNGQINSSAWQDINSMTADETKNDGDIFYAVSTDNRTSWGVAKASDGVRKIARNNSGTWQYNNDAGTTVSTGYDIANASYTTISPILSQSEGYQYMHFKPDGTKVWVGGQQQDTIYEYDLSTAFDLSTISYGRAGAFSTSTQSRSFFMKSDGTRAYIGNYTGTIYQLDLSTAWNISTATYSSVSMALGHYTQGFYIKSDGTKLYNINQSGEIKEFTLNTSWDISNTTLNNTVTLPNSLASTTDIFFSNDGTKFFVTHYDSNRGVSVYSLSTAWDTSSTITFITNYATTEVGSYIPSSVGFNSDGSKMYVMNSENTSTSPGRRILEYATGGTTIGYSTSETWVNGTNNNEHATLQQALTSQSFNRMNKAQLDAVADGYHFSQDSADTLDLMIAPYAASGASPISDGVTINYDAEALVREAVAGTDYVAEFPSPTRLDIKSLINGNLKIRAQ